MSGFGTETGKERAPNGLVGLETALGVVVTRVVNEGLIDLARANPDFGRRADDPDHRGHPVAKPAMMFTEH